MTEKTNKMTFKSYYESLQPENPQIVLRDTITKECEISVATFYNYLSDETKIPKLIKEKIAQIINKPLEELFPITIQEDAA